MHNNKYLWIDLFLERILQELKLDGRISNIELERIGLSASATLRRVQDLERKGSFKVTRVLEQWPDGRWFY